MRSTMIGPALLFFLLFSAASGWSQEYRLGGSEPSWTEKIEPDLSAPIPKGEASDGIYYLLNERQVNLFPGVREQHIHQVYAIANSSGLENSGTLTIEFDPSYQDLRLHRLAVRREGRTLDQLPRAKITLLQREANLEYRIYDGSKTLSIIIPDVRVGDVIEYSCTLHGANPVFGNGAFDFWYAQGTTGIRRAYYRVISPPGKSIQFKNFALQTMPRAAENRAGSELVWDLRDLPALLLENNAPSWYFSVPAVQTSSYSDWAEVADWAERVYAPFYAPAAAVVRTAARLSRGLDRPEDKAAAFIAFVQDEIRYLGIEVGPGSHRPNPPALVIERRFGDCKDKSLLLSALCRAGGLEAYPVLVNTFMGEHVAEYLPSPSDFDHVITLLRVGGKEYWIDPTSTLQGTALEAITPSDCPFGLVVRAGTAALSPNPLPSRTEAFLVIKERFNVAAGFDQTGRLDIETLHRYDSADHQRRYFSENSRAKIEKDFITFYSDFLKDIELAGQVETNDDRRADRFTVRESYLLNAPWTENKETGQYTFDLYPHDLGYYFDEPNSVRRAAPYAVYHPVHIVIEREIMLPAGRWNFQGDSYEIKNGYFVLSGGYHYDDGRLLCRYEYRSLKDHVLPADLSAYAKDIAAANEKMDISITKDPSEPEPLVPSNGSSARSLEFSPDDRTEIILNVLFMLLFSLLPVPIVVILILRRSKRRSRSFYNCRVCGRSSDHRPSLSVTQCPLCEPPTWYCSEHMTNHLHRHH